MDVNSTYVDLAVPFELSSGPFQLVSRMDLLQLHFDICTTN